MKKVLIPFMTAFLCYACGDKALNVPEPDYQTAETFYRTEADALQAVNAAYASLAGPDLYGRMMHVAQELMSDETEATTTCNPLWQAMRRFETSADNPVFSAIWTGAYQGVYRTNLAIGRIPEISMNSALKNRLVGEAYFLRGLYYFILVTNFGEVPLLQQVVDYNSRDQKQPARASVARIYEIILADFAEAEKRLPVSYTGVEVGRATRGAAKGFRAKALLYRAGLTGNRADYTAAAQVFKEIIDAQTYDLVPNYADNFTETGENNRESLFEVQFSTTVNPGVFCDECGTGSLRGMEFGVRGRANHIAIPSEMYLKQFVPGDPRLAASVFGPEGTRFDKQDYYKFLQYRAWEDVLPRDYAFRKYQKEEGNEFNYDTGSGINFRLLRFADVLLMYAEAVNEVQGPTAEVLAAINRVRKRAGVPTLSVVTTKEIMTRLIRTERMSELGLEGHRWRDIVRWKIAPDVLAEQGRLFDEERDYLFPIPQSERKLNPNLTQNKGWE
ncbi:RagB/SusD family nutrient uptake outer membrane protein [Tellurirhabdus rosea]|uniref:RagB/SusD family nutrient uptake outer membrane protein n=1 Tax=Tellurirhabdus rosea TaxID=2674997 RepID=UPI002256FEA9|nr:RagB/SusD family nutrient uptake outer membrane protein [Tellurirhabdus rosea]